MPTQEQLPPLPPIPEIPPPEGDLSDVPDTATKRGLDYTGPDAENRILFINLGFFKYGTADKAHAGSIFLSLALLLVALLIMGTGLWTENTSWLDKALSSIWSAFLFVAGVSIGRGQSEKNEN